MLPMSWERFGPYVREQRERLRAGDPDRYTVRAVAKAIGLDENYYGKIERGAVQPPGEEAIRRISLNLGLDPDVTLATAGRVSRELQDIIWAEPVKFVHLIRALRGAPAEKWEEAARVVRDGEW